MPGLRQVLSNGNLVFPPFQAEDYRQEVHAQVYACLAKNQFGSIISRDVNVRAGKKTLSFILFYSEFSFVRHFNDIFLQLKSIKVDSYCIMHIQ